MNGKQRARLEDFVGRGDKSLPPAFIGREEILSDIALAAHNVWTGSGTSPGTRGDAGTTRIIQGAPGAGKSSILGEALKRSLRGAPARVVVVESSLLEENVSFVIDLLLEAGRADPSRWKTLARKTWSDASRNFGAVSIAGFGVGLKERGISGMGALAREHPPGQWIQPVILGIDEAQNLPRDPNAPHGLMFRSLHGGAAGLPITLVLAGLGNTGAVASDMGLTRGRTDHNIGAMSEDEAQRCITLGLAHFGIDTSGYTERLVDISGPCEGWPHHLHHLLKAVGAAVLKTDGDLGRMDWVATERRAAELRRGYYRQQRSSEMRDAVNLTAAVMTHLDRECRQHDIKTLLRTLHKRDPIQYPYPRDWDADGFFMHLVHKGALHEQEEDRFVCPIPSFRTYLIERGTPSPGPGTVPERS
ncbi:MAG: hypothetical protein OXF07_04955 [Rhodobacter sp.]|nr:hypothetical protein [Rhodobacter sp.]